MKNSPFVLSALVAATLAGAAFGDHYDFTGTSKGTSTDLMSSTLWTNGLGEAAAPSAGNDYLITGNRWCGFTGGTEFPGDTLTLGVSNSRGNLRQCGNGVITFPSLVSVDGYILHDCSSGTMTLDGSITVSSALQITSNGRYNGLVRVPADFHGSGNLLVTKEFQSATYLCYWFTGDASDFTGTMSIGYSNQSGTSYLAPVYVGDKGPRKITVNPCGRLRPCGSSDGYGVVSVDTLTLKDKAELGIYVSATTNSFYDIAQTLTLPATGQARLLFMSLPDVNASVRRVAILRAPTGQGLSESSFRLTYSGTAQFAKLTACQLEVVTEGDYDVLYLVMDKWTYYTAHDSWGQSAWLPKYSSRWSGVAANTVLDSETSYLSWNKQLLTPNGGANVFAGKRLVNGYTHYVYSETQTVDDFILLPGSNLSFFDNGTTVCGNINLFDPLETGTAVSFQGYANRTVEVRSIVKGSANLTIKGVRTLSTPNNGKFNLFLSGTNSAYTGKINLTQNSDNSPLTNMTVIVTNAIALGGPRASFAYDAFAMDKWSRLRVKRTTAFDEPTRGFYVSGNAYVDVVDATNTFTLGSQTTMAGQLVKEGAGTLAVGGTLKFTSKQTATPLAGTNILTVSKGWIRPASKTGADGLAITFKEGTGLKFTPLAETDADVKAYGLCDVAWATPFDLTATDGKLTVAVEVPSGTKGNFSFGICTVAESAADALEGNIVLDTLRGYKGTVVRESAANGAVTFRADYIRPGFVWLLK